ncbi:hypothetical protein PILCRDRAFT_811722 [Piloderma croceum F 1598]|uniref:Uncharacterized protein n=1 Tax=Piloderma croceum (strain F 1598) TaxID=765440 RepID=A0A0C3BXF1_PILCF|nr:hypothetical protein PILCRDRAFT_811722 [Piloderma croceum F 1598]
MSALHPGIRMQTGPKVGHSRLLSIASTLTRRKTEDDATLGVSRCIVCDIHSR